ncbi:hypothetical protein NDU88_004262 [Pleurodeles waltl]|uniref:Uncharacterized protein n=1 Tax=Pleurodeles waltl TaxID=8319 RepID=A0AAV7PFI2_PLEWA|nr:hypothetical protein NDU88_004262 [Pleurodeles waltl]
MPRFSTGGRIRISPSAIMQLGGAPCESNARRASRAAPTLRRSSSLPTCLCLGWKASPSAVAQREMVPQASRDSGARLVSRAAPSVRRSTSPPSRLCPSRRERIHTSVAGRGVFNSGFLL